MVSMARRLTSAKGVGYSVLQWSSRMSVVPFSRSTRRAASISSISHIPVDITTGRPVFASASR